MRNLKEDFGEDVEQFARALAWSDAISYALMLPLLALLGWWVLQQ